MGSVNKCEEQARLAYYQGNYLQAVSLYSIVEHKYLEIGDLVMAAEMANNRSVSLLLSGKPKEALDACLKTDELFSSHGDKKRQAIALGNQASAYQALGQKKTALALYQKASELFKEIGDQEYRPIIQKNISIIQLRLGQYHNAITSMTIALENNTHPGFRELILKKLLHFLFK